MKTRVLILALVAAISSTAAVPAPAVDPGVEPENYVVTAMLGQAGAVNTETGKHAELAYLARRYGDGRRELDIRICPPEPEAPCDWFRHHLLPEEYVHALDNGNPYLSADVEGLGLVEIESAGHYPDTTDAWSFSRRGVIYARDVDSQAKVALASSVYRDHAGPWLLTGSQGINAVGASYLWIRF